MTGRHGAYLCGGDMRPGPRDGCPGDVHDYPLPPMPLTGGPAAGGPAPAALPAACTAGGRRPA